MKVRKERQGTNVAQKAIIVNDDGRMLTIRRSGTDIARPFYWDLPGGELDFGEGSQEGIIREIKEETNLEVQDLSILDVISKINNKGEFWVTICYRAKFKSGEIKLSYEHDDFQWIIVDKFLKLKATWRNKKFVEKFMDSF